MDDMVYPEDHQKLSFNFNGNVKHASANDPNISWHRPCGNGSCDAPAGSGCAYGAFKLVLVAAVTVSLSVVTVLGNFLVMLSIRVNRKLQTVNNYFLFSLACADLIIGLLPMNLYNLYIVMGYWPLGAVVCDLWLALDYAIGNASVMHLLIISFDRYFCLTRPLTYPARRTTRLARLTVAAAWVLSFLLWAPAILFWQSLAEGERIVPDGQCYIQLLSSPAVTLTTTLPSFYLPVLVMVVLYTCISRTSRGRLAELRTESEGAGTSSGSARRRSPKSSLNKWRCLSPEPKSDSERLDEGLSVEAETSTSPKLKGNSIHSKGPKNSLERAERADPTHVPAETDRDPGRRSYQKALEQNGSECSRVIQSSPVQNGPSTLTRPPKKPLKASPSYSQAKRRRRIIARERRVTRIISGILLAFIVTWTPYNVMAVVGTFCRVCIPDTVWTAGYWLCYINSTINPACYALCNATFRKTFLKLLRCRCKNLE